MQELLQDLLTFAYVVASMFGMGLSLTLGEILRPLRQIRLVAMALLANFLIVPLAAWAVASVVSDPSIQIGLLLMGMAAGAPFLLKLGQIAGADPAETVGLLVLLVVGTVIYLPLVLPLVLEGVTVDSSFIAVQLVGEILVPLALGLVVHQRYPEGSDTLRPEVAGVANVSLALLVLLMLLSNLPSVLELASGAGLIAPLAIIAVAIVSGWLLGGPRRATREGLALGTGQRNFAAAFLIAGGALADRPDVFVFLSAAAVVDLIVCFVLAGEFGRRSPPVTPTGDPEIPA